MQDGTVAVEIAADQALVQWPFMTDMSMVDALVRVFQLPPALLESQMPNTTDGLNPDQAGPTGPAPPLAAHNIAASRFPASQCMVGASSMPQSLSGCKREMLLPTSSHSNKLI